MRPRTSRSRTFLAITALSRTRRFLRLLELSKISRRLTHQHPKPAHGPRNKPQPKCSSTIAVTLSFPPARNAADINASAGECCSRSRMAAIS